MRASTLFALTLAVILGLGVATAAKFAGFFNSPQVTAAPVAKKAEIQVLVAAKNLFAGDVIDASGVRVRTLRAEEVDAYTQTKDHYLPAVPQAAVLRIADKNIYADQPILKDSLKDMAKPEGLKTRLLPQMRAVNLSLPKERCAGGQIQVGDWVDVFLTSDIDGGGQRAIRTACIAPKVRVIAKRNTLWPVFAPLPDQKPVDFTIEVNSYRGALLEACRSKGDMTLAALGAAEQRQLETQRERLLQMNPPATQSHFLPPDSSEGDDENARVLAFTKGEQAVSEVDLIRIFGLKMQTPPPPLATVSVERVNGTSRAEPVIFTTTGALISDGAKRPSAGAAADPARNHGQAAAAFQFHTPDCPTCGTNTKGKKLNQK